MKKCLVSLFFILMSGVACVGQSSFQEITPGTSTRTDVARVFGKPLRTISATCLEFNPPEGIAKLEVEYGAGSDIVERVEVYFVRPVSRAALIKKFSLPQQAAATQKNPDDRLVEYFGGSSLIALTYASGDGSSGVSQVGYYSRQLIASVAGIDVPAPNRPMQLEEGFALDGTRLTYYPRDSVELCLADCANNPNCKGFAFIKAGTYNPGDSAMCYLLSAVTRKIPAKGHISGIK